MILTVTPNPAFDVTYELQGFLIPNAEHRVSHVALRAGGKGINVARVLKALGEPVRVTGFASGACGEEFRLDLDRAGVPHDFVDALPDVRRTLVVRDGNDVSTSFWEPGYPPDHATNAEESLISRVRARLGETDVLVVSGSLPPGVNSNLPARLAHEAKVAGIPCIVDTSGDALGTALADGSAVVMPNRDEIASISGRRPHSPADAAKIALRFLKQHKPPAIVVTLGSDGMIVATDEGSWWARVAEIVTGNPTGAGDAACAAVARALRHGFDAVDWPGTLTDAVALSAAAVKCPVAGDIDLDAYGRWQPKVTVDSL